MKVAGSAVLHADPERVWAALHDPAVLGTVIPGCQGLTALGENHFGMTVTLGVASIKGSYSGEVELRDGRAPESLVMHAVGSGGPGTIDTTVQVELVAGADGTTTLSYDADAVVGGMVGGVGQRVLVSVARRTAGLFFAAVDDVLTAAPVETPAPAETAWTAGTTEPAGPARPEATGPPIGARADGPGVPVPTRGRPAPAAGRSGVDLVALAGAALFGAAATALGVVLGARVGRRGR